MKNSVIVFIALIALNTLLLAQETKITLPTTDSTSAFTLIDNDDGTSSSVMKFFGDGGFYLNGTLGSGNIPTSGEGTRLMWYPKRAAFRAGYVDDDQWNTTNIGKYSTAIGYNLIASGLGSTAMGYNTIASGVGSFAMGCNTTASGSFGSTAMGEGTTASGDYSTAMGYKTTASGYASTATGVHTIANGDCSTAMGNYASTKSFEGAFVIGDNSTTTNVEAETANQMVMRFKGGYKLYTNATMTAGVIMSQGDNSWSSISDSTKKENFAAVDKEYFLSSLSKIKLVSWNYKGQNPENHRHYGPMAQDIFHYFGKDEYGTIGNDTTLATADMDGIMMICLQGLEKRTSELRIQKAEVSSKNEELEKQLSVVSNQYSEVSEQYGVVSRENEKMKNEIAELKKSFEEMKTLVAEMANREKPTTEIAKN